MCRPRSSGSALSDTGVRANSPLSAGRGVRHLSHLLYARQDQKEINPQSLTLTPALVPDMHKRRSAQRLG
jgi:hypothetical protein